jgi:hypothetical protein
MRVMKLTAIAVIVLAAGQAWGQQWVNGTAEIVYDQGTGILSLVNNTNGQGLLDSGGNATSLDDFTVFLPTSTYNALTNLNTSLGQATAWKGASLLDGAFGAELDWGKAGTGFGTDTLPNGTYMLAQLAPNLNASAFGNGGNGGNGAGNTTDNSTYGSVAFGNDNGDVDYENVNIIAAPVPEPCAFVGMFGGGVIGLVGFAARRRSKVAV